MSIEKWRLDLSRSLLATTVIAVSIEQRGCIDWKARRKMKERMRARGSGIFFHQ